MADMLRAHSEAVRRRLPVREGAGYGCELSPPGFVQGQYVRWSSVAGRVSRRKVLAVGIRSITLRPIEPLKPAYRPLSTRAVTEARPLLDAMQEAVHRGGS